MKATKKTGKYAEGLAGVVESRNTAPEPSTNGDESKVVVAGKSNKDVWKEKYRQTSVWVESTVHDEIKVALIREKKDFSTLVGELLSEWLGKRGKERA